jgi:formate dehydrogenase major subunit
VPGLGTTLGRGGATTFPRDLVNADVITIMGSNMAENHPVAFQWVIEARERGAEVVHVDPRFTRTSATATRFVGIRAGSDIAFLGGLVSYILERGLWFDEYVRAYTNAGAIVCDEFADTEDLDGLFSGWDPETRRYDASTWRLTGDVDTTLEHPRCVLQVLKRHFARYTPELVAETCGCSVEEFLAYAETICRNSGRERTGAFVYAVGWTQHTVGAQVVRAAAIVQLLLGNVGRPGGGILALRGHASIQGSTDIPTLYHSLPGYLDMPHVDDEGGLAEYVERASTPSGGWANADAYLVSLLKAWWGDAATAENDFRFDWLPRIDDDNSHYWTVQRMLRGGVTGYIVAGENPAVGSANGRAQRLGLAQLDWLVVRDLVEIETASFWYDAPEIESGELRTEEIATEVFFFPAASHVEKDGSFTNTQRLLQWHHKAVEPPGDSRSELWFYFHLGRMLRERLAGSDDPRDRPLLDLTWDYPVSGETDDPSAEAVLAEVNGFDADGRPLSGFAGLRADGSTASGCWIYSGAYAGGENQAARRRPHWEQSEVAPDWGWAWPANRRVLYNRAAADAEGRPWSERKRLVWWDGAEGRWTGDDAPDFDATKPPGYVPPAGATGFDAIAGDKPFTMQDGGEGMLFVPAGLEDGPLPAHYEPHESPQRNPLYGQQASPRRQVSRAPEDPFNPTAGEPGSEAYPYVLTTYRLTEHHAAGGFTRFTPYLAELQPGMFVEVHPELARERGLEHAGWATIVTARSAIEARVLVTRRMRPVRLEGGRVQHQVGLPYHWGSRGLTTGGSANDLLHLVLDPNVHIQEAKALTCDIRPGRRPRGPALRRFVEGLREAAR